MFLLGSGRLGRGSPGLGRAADISSAAKSQLSAAWARNRLRLLWAACALEIDVTKPARWLLSIAINAAGLLGAACALKIDVTKPARCLLSIEICAPGLLGAACALEIDDNKPARCLLCKARKQHR